MRDIDFLNIMMARAKLVGSVVAVDKHDLHTGWRFIVHVGDTTSYYANFDEAMAYIGRVIPENDRLLNRLYAETCN